MDARRWVARAFVPTWLLLATQVAARPETTQGQGGALGARWRTDVIELSVEPSYDRLGSGALDALVLAVNAWQGVRADLPTVVVTRGKGADLGYRPGERNFNTVRFAPNGDPLAKGALAITVITFDTSRGQVLDADIVINGEHHFDLLEDEDEFAVRHAIYDLQNVLTHEFGHLLGLGEEYDDENATMYAYSLPGETHKRRVSQVDRSKVATLYNRTSAEPPSSSVAVRPANLWCASTLWSALALLGALVSTWFARRSMARVSASLALAGAALALGLAPVMHPREATSETAMVVGSDSRWENGLIVTKLELEPAPGQHDARELTVLGGQVGAVTQVVGHALPPPVGGRIRIEPELKSPAPSDR